MSGLVKIDFSQWLLDSQTFFYFCFEILIHLSRIEFPFLSKRPVIFIQILIEHSVSKQWIT